MTFNIDKCNVIFFNKRPPIVLNYRIENHNLNRVAYIKDLGVIFDSTLHFDRHINCVVSKASSALGLLYRKSMCFRHPRTLITLYFAFVRSHLIYCSVIWTPSLQYQISKLESVQHRLLRYLSYKTNISMDRLSHDYSSISSKFYICSIMSFHRYQESLFLFKIFHSHIDCSYLLSLINLHLPPRFFSITPYLLTQRLYNYDLGHRYVINRCSAAINYLSVDIDLNTISIDSFKLISKSKHCSSY